MASLADGSSNTYNLYLCHVQHFRLCPFGHCFLFIKMCNIPLVIEQTHKYIYDLAGIRTLDPNVLEPINFLCIHHHSATVLFYFFFYLCDGRKGKTTDQLTTALAELNFKYLFFLYES